MKKIYAATQNNHKINEFNLILQLLDIHDFQILPIVNNNLNIIEDGKTYQENTEIKLKEFMKLGLFPLLADDSGFEIDFLDNQPGIHSARFLGETSYSEKIQTILDRMKKDQNRTARFICCLGYYDGSKMFFETGICNGKVASQPKGSNGFGYDPIFCPNTLKKTMAELTDQEKNRISHRALALKKLMLNLHEKL